MVIRATEGFNLQCNNVATQVEEKCCLHNWTLNREFVKDVNKIIFDFIWKGKDKIKRSALISDIEDGGLKAPHLDSIIETQRILCCKKLASDQPSDWKKNSTALS